MSTIIRDTETILDDSGNVIEQHSEERYFYKDNEPDYVKIYTNVWSECNQFPDKYSKLFFQLAIRMSYCNSDSLDNSQIVYVMGPQKKEIMTACGWKTETPLVKGLKVLCDCGAIKRVSRGIYQINPSYAAKGSWKYNNKLKTGGVRELVEWFDLSNNSNDTQVDCEDDNA